MLNLLTLAEGSTEGGVIIGTRTRQVDSRDLLVLSVSVPLWEASSTEEFLGALVDGILGKLLWFFGRECRAEYICVGYRRLLDLGVLHRNINNTNVVLLRGAGMRWRRPWLGDHSKGATRNQFAASAKSESGLWKLLNVMDRDPGVFITDFDLCMKSSSIFPLGDTDEILNSMGGPGETMSQLEPNESLISEVILPNGLETPSKRLKAKQSTSAPDTPPQPTIKGCVGKIVDEIHARLEPEAKLAHLYMDSPTVSLN